MYNLLALLTGTIIAVMVSVNGKLTSQYDIFIAAVIIHVVGVIFAYILCKITKKQIKPKKNYPIWLYLGGAIGVLTTVFNNYAFGKISMTSIMALGLFGQTVTSLIIDSMGLLGMKKHPLKKSSILGIVFSLVGIAVMVDGSVGMALYAVLFSFCSGISNVLSRTVNAKLSEYIGELQSSFINHVVGLPITVIIAVLFSGKKIFGSEYGFSSDIWIYLGGTLGVCTVLLYNIIVPKISAFRVTLIIFVAQVFSGIAIDILTKNGYTKATFVGGILVAVGGVLNLIYEQILLNREKNDTIYRENINHMKQIYESHLLELAKEPKKTCPNVVFATRPQREIHCPHCWTIQSSKQDSCYGYNCNTKFVFQDEIEKQITE